ncbi:GAF domain-containing protein [Sphingomonas sp. ASV193]|uniref:GAF domain-containing protein n=1 Tax=Sphingomonas sp. ASV193 TaxID=3144405 RepID=UPI0032E8C729
MPALFADFSSERIIDATLGFVVTANGRSLELGFMLGFDAAMAQRCLRLDFWQAVCGTIARTGQAMHLVDVQRSLDPLADLVRSAGVTAYACEPLMIAGQVIGTLSFASRSRLRLDLDDLDFFAEVAMHLAQARHGARSRAADSYAMSFS